MLVKQAQDPRAAVGGLVEVDVQVRDPLDAEGPAQLVTDERHRVLQGGHRRVPLSRLADHADPDPRVAQVGRRLDRRDRREPDPRIRDVAVTIAPISCRRSSSTRSVRWLIDL